MSRKVFDKLTSWIGVVLAVVLLVAGGLLTWGAHFTRSNVHNQLAMQQVYFPTKAQLDHPTPPETTPLMRKQFGKWAGQQVLTGAQAEAFANDYIAHHLSKMPYGGVYSKVAAAHLANLTNTTIATEEATVFQGTTLRGMLLEAYAFGTIGSIMVIAAIASFIAGIILAVLAIFGFIHASRVPETRQLGGSVQEREVTAATA
jgi:hypothetical protein